MLITHVSRITLNYKQTILVISWDTDSPEQSKEPK